MDRHIYHAARALLKKVGMARDALVAKVICFTCRETTCACVAALNSRLRSRPEAAGLRKDRFQVARAVAWLGGACVAGTALGAAVAFLLGS
jgi:hypothetical protein